MFMKPLHPNESGLDSDLARGRLNDNCCLQVFIEGRRRLPAYDSSSVHLTPTAERPVSEAPPGAHIGDEEAEEALPPQNATADDPPPAPHLTTPPDVPGEPAREARSHRDRHPPVRLTYDAPGEPQLSQWDAPTVHALWATHAPPHFMNYNLPQLWDPMAAMYPRMPAYFGLPRLQYIAPPVPWGNLV